MSHVLTQMVIFPIWIPDCDSYSPAFLGLFLRPDASICSTMAFPPFGNSGHVVVSVFIDFPSNSQQDVSFHRIAYDYYRADWDGLRDHLRDVPWRISYCFCFCILWEGSGWNWCICFSSYQVKPHLSPWFPADCTAAMVHRNHFFQLHQGNKSSESRVKFRQPSNHCKRVQEAANLHTNAYKTKESITSQKPGSRDFWWIACSVLNKCKSALPPLFNGPEVLSSASDKSNLFAKNFSENSYLFTVPVFPSRTNLTLHNISVTPKMVKKDITNLNLAKASGPDCIFVFYWWF